MLRGGAGIRFVKFAAALVVLLCVVFAAVAYFTVLQPAARKLEPATPEIARVDMLEGRPDAVVLSRFVTGDVPRLLRGDALDRWSEALWFTDNVDAGNLIGAGIFGMMGMPLATPIGTAFVHGRPIATFDCLTVGCINWPRNAAAMWGLGAMQGQAAALGPEVQWEHKTFLTYDAYLDEHANVAADPLRWFADQGAEIPEPDSDGLRLVVINLPTHLVSTAPDTELELEDAAMAEEFTARANDLIAGLGGELQGIHGANPMPLWVMKNGSYLWDDDDGTRRLPDYATHSPTLRVRIPVDAIPILGTRLAEASFPGADYSVIEPAIERAFAAWGIDAECLPQCGGVDPATEFRDSAEMSVDTPPFWTLSFWIVPPPV